MSRRKCIFHIPFHIDPNYPSGSQIRPVKMIQGLTDAGYDVDIVMGYGKERKNSIKKIKLNIKNGVKYDFLYSESSTEPTLLTEKNHFPCYPMLDFDFFRYCKKNGIKIGLFYRDVYWKFKDYKKKLPLYKYLLAIVFYKYDLIKYNQLVNILYLPSIGMYKYMKYNFKEKINELPPAVDELREETNKTIEKDDLKLNIFYVGGVDSFYNIEQIFIIANKMEFINLTVCCRKNDWQNYKSKYEKYLNERIKIVHESGDDLNKYYENADLLSLYLEPSVYREFAMPVKLFEYIKFKKCIIATQGSATGNFVEKNDIGWSISYSIHDLMELLNLIKNDRKLLRDKEKNFERIISDNLWISRANKVARDLL